MKRILLICVGVFLFLSCKTTFYCTPEDDYIEFVKEANTEIMSKGYIPVYCDCDTVLQSAYHWRGYTWPMDRIYVSNYIFQDSVGDTIQYSVAVNYDCTNMGDYYIDSAVVQSCYTTKESDKDFCNSEIMLRLSDPPKRNVRYTTEEGILGIIIGVPAAVLVSFFIWSAVQNHH